MLTRLMIDLEKTTHREPHQPRISADSGKFNIHIFILRLNNFCYAYEQTRSKHHQGERSEGHKSD